ncbi:MAG: DUF2909 domain-containing protein [Gammaproteobacteria bacterium]|nr:DUF2909 domain-containing protein [Gammaproteobacteria bacterium]MCP5200542.1 DUF2909 domain-containing protein [Gammaproteobacteria bacterium]
MADSPYIKAFIIGVFVMILLALGTAGFRVFRKDNDGKGNDTAAVKALTIRVALSFALVIIIGVLYLLGIIEPNG